MSRKTAFTLAIVCTIIGLAALLFTSYFLPWLIYVAPFALVAAFIFFMVGFTRGKVTL